MRYCWRRSVGLLAGVALFVAGCGQASSPPLKAHAAAGSALRLSAGPVKAAANGEHIVVLTATGQAKVGKSYSLTASGAVFAPLGVPSLGTRKRAGWTVEYREEGTSGRTRFVLIGPVPSASPGRSNTLVVWW